MNRQTITHQKIERNVSLIVRFVAKQEGHWSELDTGSTAMLEIFLPNETIAIRKPIFDRTDGLAFSKNSVQGYQTFALEPSVESVTKLLTIAVDHIDTLLEDWYPILGNFVVFFSLFSMHFSSALLQH